MNIAQASLEECRYYLILAKDLKYRDDPNADAVYGRSQQAAQRLREFNSEFATRSKPSFSGFGVLILDSGLSIMPGTLYIVATPIGNLEDITLRALRVLKDVDLIAAEDTRHTRILLDHHGIHASVTSYHEHNERAKAQELVRQLEKGVNIALVSDAGTPAISDPGYRLILTAITAGARVVPIPGASALTAVLSACGLPTDGFVFEGFLPAKQQQRRSRLQTLCREIKTLIFYEAPHRLCECLGDIGEILGDREMTLAREVTKVHEEFLRGPVSQILQQIADRQIKGEVTLVVRGWDQQTAVSLQEVKQEAHELLAQGMRVKEIAEVLGEKYGYAKKEIYRIAVEQKKSINH